MRRARNWWVIFVSVENMILNSLNEHLLCCLTLRLWLKGQPSRGFVVQSPWLVDIRCCSLAPAEDDRERLWLGRKLHCSLIARNVWLDSRSGRGTGEFPICHCGKRYNFELVLIILSSMQAYKLRVYLIYESTMQTKWIEKCENLPIWAWFSLLLLASLITNGRPQMNPFSVWQSAVGGTDEHAQAALLQYVDVVIVCIAHSPARDVLAPFFAGIAIDESNVPVGPLTKLIILVFA